jgi:hypothetical protein
MSNKISDLKRSLERHVGGESGEHQPTRVVKPDNKFIRLLRFKSYRVSEGFLRASSSLGKPRQSLTGHESEPQFYFAPVDTNVFTGPISRSASDMSLLCTFSKGDRNA